MGAIEASGESEGDLIDVGDASMTGTKQELGKKKVKVSVNQTFTLKEPTNSADGNTFVSPFHVGGEDESPTQNSQQEDDFDRFLKDISK